MAVEFSTAQAFPPSTEAVMEINTEPTPGQDGTLADDKRASLGVLYPRDSDPSKWYGSASAGAFLYPGTYYFQVSALVLDSPGDGVQWCSTVPAGSFGIVHVRVAGLHDDCPSPTASRAVRGGADPGPASAQASIGRRQGQGDQLRQEDVEGDQDQGVLRPTRYGIVQIHGSLYTQAEGTTGEAECPPRRFEALRGASLGAAHIAAW
jgi:hypothetical protein